MTKFKVKAFRSYRVCISMEEWASQYSMQEVCTHLFSFEKAVPYRPEPEQQKSDLKIEVDTKTVPAVVKSGEEDIIESVLKQQLSDIDNFVRDDFKSEFQELKNEIVEEIEEIEKKVLHSSSDKPVMNFILILSATLQIWRNLGGN